jgi:GNAT superfamily N-acetyltransferase
MEAENQKLRIVKAQPHHLPRVVELMKELAEYEKMTDELFATKELLERHLFGDEASAELLIGFVGSEIRGYAIYFRKFSSFPGRPGLHLEDIYVQPSARGVGLGKALFLEVARIAHEAGCPRLEWIVLNWNQKARTFFESLGAEALEDWIIYRMDEAVLSRLLSEK